MKHTPGKWEVKNLTDVFTEKEAVNSEGIKADMYDGWQVADCSVGLTRVKGELKLLSLEEVKANAKLIAAAPNLLEALIDIQDAQNNPSRSLANLNGAIVNSLEAIKKATE